MTTSEATAPATDTRTVVRSYFEALGRADRNAQTDWYADDASGHIYGVIGPAGKAEMRSFFHDLFDACPDYTPFRDHFWFDWGPVFYRGRLDGSARVLCVASDPGATERIAGRTLVGDAGQRVQSFLVRLGLTRSYLCLNAFSYALIPSHGSAGATVVRNAELTTW